jgi:hypothetical protein
MGDGRNDHGISHVWKFDFNPCEQVCPPRLIKPLKILISF